MYHLQTESMFLTEAKKLGLGRSKTKCPFNSVSILIK